LSASGNMVTARNTEPIACEGIADIQTQPITPYPIVVSKRSIESESFRIEWEMNEGITAWIDKTRSADLLDDAREHAPFTPVYEVTPAQDEHNPSEICSTRRRMGRNRKGTNVQRDTGRLTRVSVLDNGPLFAVVE
ncbi:glycoside hydrolase, partial [Clostridium perfringens]